MPDHVIDVGTLKRPNGVSQDLQWQFDTIAEYAKMYNKLTEEKGAAEKLREADPDEMALTLLSPFLLAIAVGLRIAKVEAEIRLDRRAAKSV
jgi:hypothetical protein